MKKQESVWVVNHGAEPFSDRFDGEDFTIAPDEALEIAVDCAKLIFGFGEGDSARAIKRLGWAPTSADMKGAIARLHTFSFHMEQSEAQKGRSSAPATNRNAADSSGSVADRPRRRRNKKRAKRARPPALPTKQTPAAQPAAG